MRLLDVISTIPFYHSNQKITEKIYIKHIQMDHRLIKEGDLFICIRGFTVDGHTFVNGAVQNGAKVIIAEEELDVPDDIIVIIVPDTTRALALIATAFYQYPTSDFSLIGITGTNGKTTITYLLDSIFRMNQQKTGIIGTIQVKIEDEILPVKNTTPDALQLQRIFHQMNEKEVDVAMMEVSSHALDMGRVYGTDFDIAVFTNLTQDHLDYHKDMDDYLRAKTLLFTGLGNGYSNQPKYAVLNADDVHSQTIAKSTSQPIVTYGIEETADVMAKNIVFGVKGMQFQLCTPSGNVNIDTPLTGKFNMYNILAAVSTALLKNVSIETIRQSLETIYGVDGRFEQVDIGQNYAVIVDYAHTPDSLENVLETIREFAQNKVYVVVGTGGDRDKTKRPLMANTAISYGDWAIFTSDNPRTEKPEDILEDMTRGIKQNNYEVIVNRKEAIEKAVQYAKKGDVILIAGKGHETYQEINGVRYDFDDRLTAKEVMKQKEQ